MKIFLSSFKPSLKFSLSVLKDMTLYFGLYFLAFSLVILFFFQNSPDFSNIELGLLFVSHAFTAFIIPYYAYKSSQGAVPKFWDFIKENIWPMVLANIKAFFIILLFLILLIIPGFYKMARLAFLAETVLFDKAPSSTLKQAQYNTKNYFWAVVLLIIGPITIGFLISSLAELILLSSFKPLKLMGFILDFYIGCFFLLWKCQFFFEIKKQRGEAISC